jgi:hypothetical protein
MNRNQLITLWVGVGIAAICLIFPKWKIFNEKETIDLGYHSVFNPPIEIVNAKNKKQKRIIHNPATTPGEYLRREKEKFESVISFRAQKSYSTVKELPKFALIQDTGQSFTILLITAILTIALIMTFKSKPAPEGKECTGRGKQNG